MAVNKTLQKSTLNIEIQAGFDKVGSTKYKKKNFSGIKLDATTEAVNNVAEAIKLVLAAEARDTFMTDVSLLELA